MIIQIPHDSEAPEVSAAASPSDVKLGARFTLFVTAIYGSGVEVNLREPVELGGAFEVTKRVSSDTPRADGRHIREWQLEVYAWQLGELEVPPVAVTFTVGGRAGQVVTNAVPVRVSGVLGDSDDPKLMRGYAPPIELTQHNWLWQLLVNHPVRLGLVLAGLIAAWMTVRRLRRRQRRVTRIVGGFVTTIARRRIDMTGERALERLHAIERSGVLERDADRKTGYTEMAEVIRDYLGARYRLTTSEPTTLELVARARQDGRPRTRARARGGLARALRSRQVRWLPRELRRRERRARSRACADRRDHHAPRGEGGRMSRRAPEKERGGLRPTRGVDVIRAAVPWLLVVLLGGAATLLLWRYLDHQRGAEALVWKSKRALVLVAGAALVGFIVFHLQRRRTAAMAYSQVALVGKRGIGAWLADLPGVLRVLALAALAIALMRPETYRTIKHDVDSIDIMLVVDMSKSMEETDMRRDRIDAAQRVIRRFLHRNKNDRVGLVIFGQQAMLQCPLTQDTKLLEQIVSDLAIGDVPELGTAIGDGLALGLSQLRRSDAKSKIVILLSDGDTNWVTRFDPDQAARAAKEMGVKVYTLLVGAEESDLFGEMSVNPATLRNIASITGGEYFRASDYESFDKGFQTVRSKLDTTKRTVTERVPDKQLFVPFAALAALLVLLELVLASTRLRRLP